MTDLKAESPATDPGARRPIKARQSRWASALAGWLAARNVSPNAISIASVFFAGIAGASFVSMPWIEMPLPLAGLCITAIIGIQGRLICNLLDGMVAIEGGRKSKSGEIYNDLPDRIADPIILISAGYAVGGSYGVALGCSAGLLAVMTAYVRVLGRSVGSGIYFAGPMAKQHRMAVLTVACIGAAVAGFWRQDRAILLIALIIIVAGCAWTVCRRLGLVIKDLESR